MIYLTVLAEGKSEVRFAKASLGEHLGPFSVFVHPKAVLTSKDDRRSRQYRGGVLSYRQVKTELENQIKHDQHRSDAWQTTMIDLYRLPRDFPGFAAAETIKDPHARVSALEDEFAKDIGFARFIPYIAVHEFEAMILADPSALSEYYSDASHMEPIQSLIAMRAGFANAELIDDGDQTAPSKRIIAAIPQYGRQKAIAGPLVAGAIGLPKLRQQCPHFSEWIGKLESLGQH